jgi:hypothetical protein
MTAMAPTLQVAVFRRALAPAPLGLKVRERGRLLRRGEAASLSSRERASALTGRALAGAPPTARSLVLELERSHGFCVLGVGDRPAAVWQFDAGALRALAAAIDSDVPRLQALAGLRDEAGRIIRGMRLQALRGSIGDVVVIHDRPNAISRLVGAMLLEAIVERVWLDDGVGARDATAPTCRSRGSWREGGECHTA